mmetsp:Transcript_10532/g.24964  ORF Transcript_10532/g.24964 Transcript_10532/m.24964 type:complete len:237 (-) Transcript_10532:823-1533(-)
MTYAPPRYPHSAHTGGIEFMVRVETWRMCAYLFFWCFVLIAVISTKMFVIDSLKAGLPPDTPTERLGCGAFNREGGDFSLRYGGGFNFTTESHLIERFGFPNICTNWDYSPAREITAIFFPLFEFSMMVYLSLDYISTRLSYNRGEVPRWYMIWNNGKYPITMILCAMFRKYMPFMKEYNSNSCNLRFAFLSRVKHRPQCSRVTTIDDACSKLAVLFLFLSSNHRRERLDFCICRV